MFPIRWNFPFRKKDGSISTIGAEIESGGGGGGYTLPTASAETKGGVKIGDGLSMNGEVLNNSNPTPYNLPAATSEVLGGIKVGSGLSIADGILSNPSKWADVTNTITLAEGASIQEGAIYKNGYLVLCSLRIKVQVPFTGPVVFTLPENLRTSRALLVAGVNQSLEEEGGSNYITSPGAHFIRSTGNVEAYKYTGTYSLDTAWFNFILVRGHNVPD